MAASKNLFNKERERILLDERKTENYPPFDHGANFRKKVKENWLSNDKLVELLNSTDYMELTNALINYKMDSEYLTIIMEYIDLYEPEYIKGSEYMMKVIETPLENMKRIYKKYTQDDTYIMKRDVKMFLESEIMKKQRLNK